MRRTRRPDRSTRGGFTLLELVVAVTILATFILPMLWITLSLVQFKLQPKPDDPQQASMQKQMGFLFPLMGLMFYGYASGFAFYFIISSLYSITESRLVKRALIKQGVMPDPKKKPKVEENDKPDYHGAS